MATPSTQNRIAAALQHHQAGQLQEAERIYRQILAIQPGNAQACNNLGALLKAAGRLDEAIAVLRRGIAVAHGFPQLHYNLGNLLLARGLLDDAIAVFRQALKEKSDFPEACFVLGDSLRDQGNLGEAITFYQKAIFHKPDFLAAHGNLGNILKDQGKLDEAIACYRRVLAIDPNNADAHNNLGLALKEKGKLEEAVAAFQRAIHLEPDCAGTQISLGISLYELRRLDEALVATRRAIALSPEQPEAHHNLGNVLKLAGRLDEAVAAYRQAVALRPDYASAHSDLLYTLHFHPGCDARAIAAEHRDWDRLRAEPLKPSISVHDNDRDPDRRLRIGYVSPDFRGHPIGRFLLPLLANHDHRRFEVFAYSNVEPSSADATTQQIRGHADVWRDIVPLSDAQAADLIGQDRIDVLVDLVMHMARSRLLIFARKPAPVQVTYLAYAASSGLSAMDYRLSDPYLDPDDQAQGNRPSGDGSVFCEKTVRLSETYWCYQPVMELPCLPPPALRTGFITFGCLNNFCKINEPLLSLWAMVMVAVPRSRLVLHAHEGSHRQQAVDRLRRGGVEPERVSFVGKAPAKSYFESYHSIDVALDTVPYGGGTTTCDALWMGVPVVSLAGETAVGRGGLSILSNIGLPELATHSPQEYVRIAAELANNLSRLTELRSTLRQRMLASPLMDAPRFARSVESAYRQMWRNWCESKSGGR